jgi:methylated-DNA-[protein]-cysteine S-methyltransferase
MHFDPSIVKAEFETALGPMIAAATDQGLAGIWFADQRHLPDHARWPLAPAHPLLRQAVRQMREYLAGERVAFDLPLDLRGGTPFQRTVWEALLAIPHGRTASYGSIGAQLGKPQAMRAVGAAVGRNPIGIVVPCHRVMGADGSMTGYAGGLQRKKALLALEAARA